MRRLFSSINRIEVYHLRNLLESAGVHVSLGNEYLHAVAGEIPFGECGVELWITRDEEFALAESVLAAWRMPVSSDRTSWNCASCGETIEPQFTACWRCLSSVSGRSLG